MNIKSKRWYEGQIEALETATGNLAKMIHELPYNPTPQQLENNQKYNSSIQAEGKPLYARLNELRYEYNLYYRN